MKDYLPLSERLFALKYLKTLLIITCSPEAVGLPFILLNCTCLAIKVYETLIYSCFKK